MQYFLEYEYLTSVPNESMFLHAFMDLFLEILMKSPLKWSLQLFYKTLHSLNVDKPAS